MGPTWHRTLDLGPAFSCPSPKPVSSIQQYCVNGNTFCHYPWGLRPEMREISHSSHSTEGLDPRAHQAWLSTHSSQPTLQRPVLCQQALLHSPFLIEAEPIRPESNWLSCGSRRRAKWGHSGLEASPLDQLIKCPIPSTPYAAWVPGSQALSKEVTQYKACGDCTGVATQWEGQKWGREQCVE